MSDEPSSAAWKMIELTKRTSGASEMPSSTSRSSASSSSSACNASSSASAARAPKASEARGVPVGEHSSDALARGEALVDDRLGKRALPGPPARDVQLVFGKEVRRREQVCDELRDGIDPRGKGSPRGRAFAAVFTGRAEI